MKKATRGWPSCLAELRRSMHLMDAGEQPAAGSVDRLDEVPHLLEALGRRAGRLAHRPGETHARPVAGALRGDFEQVGVERHDVGALGRAGALGYVPAQLLEQLGGGELADLVELRAVVRELQLDEVELRRAQEAGGVKASRHTGALRRD